MILKKLSRLFTEFTIRNRAYFGKAVVFLFKNILEGAALPTIAKTFLTKLRILVMSEDQPKDKSSDKLNSLMPGGNKKVTHT